MAKPKPLRFYKVVNGLETIREITRGFLPYSDFNPMSLVCWDGKDVNSYAVHHGNLVIRLGDYLSDTFSYSFIGNSWIRRTVQELVSVEDKLSYVPENIVSKIRDIEGVSIIEDRDNFDYVYELHSLAKLEGGMQKSNRKRIGTFRKSFPAYEVSRLDLSNEVTREELIELTRNWAESKNSDMYNAEEDCRMVQKFIDIADKFNTLSTGIYVGRKLVAFNLNELLDNGWVMGHFGSSDAEYEYGPLVLEHETAKMLVDDGYKYLNHQQDTGLAGLREYKLSLRPAFFLKKYTVVKA